MRFIRLFAIIVLCAALAAAADTTLASTHIKLFTPYGSAGLSKALSASQTADGNCFAGSLADSSRTDAWRCTAGNVIHDPCFQNVMGDATSVACARSPWDAKVTALRLTSPLPSAQRQETSRDKTMPWALELANGDHCALLTGATAPIAGMRINYGCPGGGLVAGDIDHGQPVWRVFYQKEGAASLDQVGIAVAWY